MANLANKYRPRTFEDVTEQKLVVDILKNMCDDPNFNTRNFLLTGPAGTGKAQPLTSEVLTPSGFIKMKDVQIGTSVFTSSGNVAKVSGVYPQGVRRIYKIVLQDRTEIEVSDEHVNVVYRYNEDKKIREDYCLSTVDLINLFETSRFKLRVDIPKVDWDERDVPIDPYLLGALIGNGSLSSGNFGFSNSEPDVVAKVDFILKRDWGMTLKKVPGDNVDYNIVFEDNHPYIYSYMGHDFSTKASMIDFLSSQGYPRFDSETIDRIVGGSASRVLSEFPELKNIQCDRNPKYSVDSNRSLKHALKDMGLLCKSVDKHIPSTYLFNCKGVRESLLRGIFDTDGTIDKTGTESISTSSEQLSKDLSFLVRSLGIRDTVVSSRGKYSNSGSCGEAVMCNWSYCHNLKVPSDISICSSEKHRSRLMKHQNEPMRNIVSIEYIWEKACQWIYVDDDDHTYISNGFIPTHNTTLGRIMANYLNDGKGSVIELDAASNGSVESIRQLTDQARSFPVGQKWKVFIIDECFTGDTEILTDEGFKRFDKLDHTEKIAQVDDSRNIKFVKPLRHIKRKHDGEMYKLKIAENAYCNMTPGHNQPVYNTQAGQMRIDDIKHHVFQKGDRLFASGWAEDNGKEFMTSEDKLQLIVAMSGYTLNKLQDRSAVWKVRVNSLRNLQVLTELLHVMNIKYSMNHEASKYIFKLTLPETYSMFARDRFHVGDMSYSFAHWVLTFLQKWYKGDDVYETEWSYTGHKDIAMLISELCAITSKRSIMAENRETGNYTVKVSQNNHTSSFSIPQKEVYEYSGDVYCVEVPTHKIIVRSQGVSFISGNCHSISSTGWQSFLKTLEESPGKSIFIFATTNPEKIPATILSRVQTFQLSKISLNGINNRLKYVIGEENKHGAEIKYTDDAVNFIAKMANGGMRDSLTQLDKCLSFSHDLTIENVTKALNLPEYDDFFELLGAYAKKDNATIAKVIDDVYDSGVNFIKWFQNFHSFVMNIVKYIYLKDINKTVIPSTYQEKISKYGVNHLRICLQLSNKLLVLNNELKTTQYLQEVALTHLCFIPPKEKK